MSSIETQPDPTTCGPEDDGLSVFVGAFEGGDGAGVEPTGEHPGGAGGGSLEGTGRTAALLAPDEFFVAFRALVGAPNIVLYGRGVEPLRTLQIAENDPAARAASDALYETCLDVPWMRFLIQPESKWAQRSLVVGSFAVGLVQGVRAELSARAEAAAAAAAANDNAGLEGAA